MSEISAHHFEKEIRHDLYYKRGIEHKDQERMGTIFNDTLSKLDTHHLRAEHFDRAMKEMKKHDEWHSLSEHKRNALTDTLKEHLGITEH